MWTTMQRQYTSGNNFYCMCEIKSVGQRYFPIQGIQCIGSHSYFPLSDSFISSQVPPPVRSLKEILISQVSEEENSSGAGGDFGRIQTQFFMQQFQETWKLLKKQLNKLSSNRRTHNLNQTNTHTQTPFLSISHHTVAQFTQDEFLVSCQSAVENFSLHVATRSIKM